QAGSPTRDSAPCAWSVRRSVPGTGTVEAAMWASRKSAPEDGPRRRYIWLRLLLILIVVLLGVYVLPTPWAFHIGGKFSPIGEWDGYGPVQASNGGRHLLYTHLRGGLLNNHRHPASRLGGGATPARTARVVTRG